MRTPSPRTRRGASRCDADRIDAKGKEYGTARTRRPRTLLTYRVELPQLETDRDRRQIPRAVVRHVYYFKERAVLDAAQ